MINCFTGNRRPPKHRGFTLSEVTISVGIISGILLPVLALLATGTRLSTVSQDQAAASKIASTITGNITKAPAGTESCLILFDNNEPEIPLDSNAGQSLYAAFSTSGKFVRTVAESEYSSGVVPADSAFYLVQISLEPIANIAGTIPRQIPLFQLEIEVEQPAMAAKINRTGKLFTSRVSAP